jgi:hypothetical protein
LIAAAETSAKPGPSLVGHGFSRDIESLREAHSAALILPQQALAFDLDRPIRGVDKSAERVPAGWDARQRRRAAALYMRVTLFRNVIALIVPAEPVHAVKLILYLGPPD